MKLKTGECAMAFQAKDIVGRDVDFSPKKGERTLLSFYRYASCPFCNLRMHYLRKKFPELQAAGLNCIAVFQSPVESIREYVGKEDSPFPIIADPQRSLYKLYGVEASLVGLLKGGVKASLLMEALKLGYKPGKMEGSKTLVPADFLINENFIVDVAYYGSDIADHIPLSAIEAWLENSNSNMSNALV